LPEVISDTSPLQYLHQLGLLHILPALVGHIVVPSSVEKELLVGRELGINLPDLGNLEWVEIRQPNSRPEGFIPSLRPLLDQLQTLRFRLSPQTRVTVLELAGEKG
jgi:predicted nucleic acid-binding protein